MNPAKFAVIDSENVNRPVRRRLPEETSPRDAGGGRSRLPSRGGLTDPSHSVAVFSVLRNPHLLRVSVQRIVVPEVGRTTVGHASAAKAVADLRSRRIP